MSDDLATLERFYRWNAPIYDLTRWTLLRHRRKAAQALKLNPGDHILDIGCGTGLNFRHIRRHIGTGGRIVGVDYSDAMLCRASRRACRTVALVQAEASQIRFNGRFDGVLIAYALTMIPQWHEALSRACDHLVEGGRIVILDFGRVDRRFAPLRHLFERYLNANHVHPERNLKEQLAQRVNQVDVLRPTNALITLMCGTR